MYVYLLSSIDVSHPLYWCLVDDGSMTKDKREASLEKIRNSNSTRCILISFKAGSTGTSSLTHGEWQAFNICALGLNLTCCNNVILVDMWWNPALEVCSKPNNFEFRIDRRDRNRHLIVPIASDRHATSIFSSSLSPRPSKSGSLR
jgi:hypothetical protein